MNIRISFVLAFFPSFFYFYAPVSSYCTRGFDEVDRPFINAITQKTTVNRSGNVGPVWSTSINGGNFVIHETDQRTSMIVPASGNYVIFVSLRNILGTNVFVYRQGSDARHLIAQSSIESLGTTFCGTVSYLENNDKITLSIEKGRPRTATTLPELQIFAYLINLFVQ